MPNIVITGSTRGIGKGLAIGFLQRDCSVMLTGRRGESVQATREALGQDFEPGRIAGYACDVRDPGQVEQLWKAAADRFGRVDIWINNAGFAGQPESIWQLDPGQAQAVIETNLLGMVYGSQTAARGMLEQGGGRIYNMEGMGGDGRMHEGLTMYGTSKYAVHYFTLALAKELEGTQVKACSLRPGMVATDMITEPYRDQPEEWQRVKRIFNIIAERPEVVTPWLVDRMLANESSGKVISFSSNLKLLLRFLTAPFNKRELFGDVDFSQTGDGIQDS